MRARGALAALAAATALGGCSAAGGGTGVTVSGKSLSVYLAAPSGGGQTAADVADAERLAFSQRAHEITSFTLRLRVVTGARPSDDARTAIQDTTAVAYLGEVGPGTSVDSVGITNAEQLLQVSATDTAQGLTDPNTPGLANVPKKYLESVKTYGRTFARVVPNTGAEAKLDAAELRALHARSVYVGTDGSDYATALLAALKGAVSGASVTAGPLEPGRAAAGSPGAVFAATRSPAAGRTFLAGVAATHPSIPLLAPSALADPSLSAGLPSAARLYVSAPGFTRASAPAAAASFTSAFRAAYGHAPAPQAIFGYEAMNAVIDVIRQAGASANSRGNVVHGFLTLRPRSMSVIGPYSIDPNGDTSLHAFVIERLAGGRVAAVTQPAG